MKIDGGCHCGAIRFSAEIDPESVIICHCTDCQTLSGSAYRTVVPAIAGTFTLQSGEPRIYIKTAEDGGKREQAFCEHCGTPIYAAPADEGSTFFGLRVGAISQRDQLPPRSQFWCGSAQDWVQNISALPQR